MDVRADPDPRPALVQPQRLKRLLPPGDPASIPELVEELGLWRRPAARRRPRVMLNMISTADGRATVGGRSGAISGGADRELFHGLRSAVDAVLVGAGTVRTERYGRIIPDASRRQERRRRGLSEEPLACIVSGQLALDPDIPLLGEPSARLVILTASAASLPQPRPTSTMCGRRAGDVLTCRRRWRSWASALPCRACCVRADRTWPAS